MMGNSLMGGLEGEPSTGETQHPEMNIRDELAAQGVGHDAGQGAGHTPFVNSGVA